jgi:signal transduction histidine kinase
MIVQRQFAEEFTASIAHEVNQPLAAIVTSAESCIAWLGKEQPDLVRARKAAERIVKTGQHASQVVRGIRAMLRRSPQLVPLDINAVIATALECMEAELQAHDVTLETQLCPEIGLLSGDPIQLQQVLVNLIRNAIESILETGGTSLRRLRVSTSIDSESGTAQVAVADSGAGLDPATLDRIFEPFFTTKKNGTGLGLSICRAIVEGHGGRLWATPRVPRGSVFQFSLACFRAPPALRL